MAKATAVLVRNLSATSNDKLAFNAILLLQRQRIVAPSMMLRQNRFFTGLHDECHGEDRTYVPAQLIVFAAMCFRVVKFHSVVMLGEERKVVVKFHSVVVLGGTSLT